jgi:hypothetical protein
MLNLVDIEKGLYGAEYKKRRHFILFILSTILTFALIILLMLTSKQKYILELIFTILVSVFYLIYAVFYFTVIRRVLKADVRFFEGASKVELSEYDVEIHSISENIKEYNGREYYVLEAKVDENLKEEDKIFYLPSKFSFKKNQKARIQVYGSIVINVELRK